MLRQLWAPWRLEYIEQADERPGCIFCEPEPELVLARGEHAFLLLNRFPYSSGHVMAAPVRHVGDYGGLTDGEVLEIHRGLCKAAEEFGCAGIRVEKPEGLEDALRKALSAGKPAVVDVVSDIDAAAERAG